MWRLAASLSTGCSIGSILCREARLQCRRVGEEKRNACVGLVGVVLDYYTADLAARTICLPFLTGGDSCLRFGGRRRSAPRSSWLQSKHLPHGGDALSFARCGRLLDLSWSQTSGVA